MEKIKSYINTEFIRLDQLLKFENLVYSGGEAKDIIRDGILHVNGEVTTVRGKKIYPGDKVEIPGELEIEVFEED